MSAGRCAWIKLCIGSLLHWPFFCLYATCPPQPSHPTSTLGEFFWRSWPTPLRVLLSGFFCEVSFVSLSTHTVLSYLQIGFASARGERRQRGGGTGGQWINHGSLVHKTSQNVNKERRFLKGDLLIVPPTECQLWLRCLVWEKNEVGRDRTGQKQSGLEEIVLTLYLGPFVCRDRFSASRSFTVCLTRTPWYTLLEYSRRSRRTVCESRKQFDFIQILIRPHKCVFIWMFHSFIHILFGIAV